MEKLPRINPLYWDNAVLLHAERIDHLRKLEVRHPAYNSGEALLHHLRDEYDNFTASWYGYVPEDKETAECVEVCVTWYQAMAIIVLDLVKTYGHSPTPSAESVYPLLRSKQEDYGYDNIHRFGRDGVLVRMHDKIARLENLAKHRDLTDADHPNHETIDDTLRDLIGYCLIGCLVEEDNWVLDLAPSPLPLPSPPTPA